jgi:hypothetical protein
MSFPENKKETDKVYDDRGRKFVGFEEILYMTVFMGQANRIC